MKKYIVRFFSILTIISCIITSSTYASEASSTSTSSAPIVNALTTETYSATKAAQSTKKTTGLYKVNGTWKYYENGKFKKVTGLVKKANANTWHYVKDGIFQKATGLVKCVHPGKHKGAWFFVRKGTLTNETGLVQCIQPGKSKGKWFFVKKGKFKTSTGYCKSIQPGKTNGRKYYVKRGALAVDNSYTINSSKFETSYFSITWSRNPFRGGVTAHNGGISGQDNTWWINYGRGSDDSLAGGMEYCVTTGARPSGPSVRLIGKTSDGMFKVYNVGAAGGDISSVLNVKVK